MRRRTNAVALQPPKLLTYRPKDWIGRCTPNPYYYPMYGWPAFKTPWESWHHARYEYLLKHRGQKLNGMDIIDVIFEDES